MPAKVALHCTSVLPLMHHVADKTMVFTVTAAAGAPMMMDSPVAEPPPKEPAMVAVPAARGRSLLRRAGLPRLAMSLAVVGLVTVMVAAYTCKGSVEDGGLVGEARVRAVGPLVGVPREKHSSSRCIQAW